MKRFGMSVCALMCFVALNQSSIAQGNPWNGSWKADPSTLTYSGATFTVTSDADGFTVTRGGTAGPKLVCDGKPQKTEAGTMTACTKAGADYALDVTRDGRQVRKTMISVSADGKTRISKSEMFPTEGSSYTTVTKAERVSGGPGMAGEWKEVKTTSSADNGVLSIEVKEDTIAFKETDTPKPIECKLDGTETKAGDTSTMSVKLADPRTLKVTYSSDGKVRRENTFELSEDGKTIVETDVTPAPSESKMTLTLHKM
jgi:hypothetical protein